MKNKINKIQIIGLILLLSILNDNILSMQKSGIEFVNVVRQKSNIPVKIDQDVQQESGLLNLPVEVIRYIIYQIIKPYESSIEKVDNVNNIFEFYSQIDLKQLKKDLVGAARASKGLRLWTLDLISKLKNKYQELVKQIKDQYQGLSKDELNSRLRNILNQINIDWKEAAKLILSGANVNAKNDYGFTALVLALMDDHKDIVQLLIDNDANVNEKISYRDNTLMLVAIRGYKDVAQLLIDNDVDINEKNNYGVTALMKAARYGKKDIVELLIGKGADINEKNIYGSTALIWATKNGHKDIVQLLIDKGVNVNEKDNYGHTALTFAAMLGHEGMVDLLKAAKNKKSQSN